MALFWRRRLVAQCRAPGEPGVNFAFRIPSGGQAELDGPRKAKRPLFVV